MVTAYTSRSSAGTGTRGYVGWRAGRSVGTGRRLGGRCTFVTFLVAVSYTTDCTTHKSSPMFGPGRASEAQARGGGAQHQQDHHTSQLVGASVHAVAAADFFAEIY
eukprot:2118228-Prymnesium_polylepis.1